MYEMNDKPPTRHQFSRRRDGSSSDKTKQAPRRKSGNARFYRDADAGKEPDPHIFGLHAAEFALRNQRRVVHTIWATENAERKLSNSIALRNLPVTRALPRELDKRVGPDSVHQGVVLEVSPPPLIELVELMENAVQSGQPIIVLDQVTDPHNVGAILRSCAVFGAAGLIMTERHSPRLGGTLAKSASGALDLLPICLVQNLANAIAELKKQNLTVIGLDGADDNHLLENAMAPVGKAPVALVLGAEGKGLRELSRRLCDMLCKIGADGPIASLNVSNAAAVALHLVAMQRRNSQ